MTKEEKKERRKLRHELQKVVAQNHFSKEVRLKITQGQYKSMSRIVADQILAGKNPREVVTLGASKP